MNIGERIRRDWVWIVITAIFGGAMIVNIGRNTLRAIHVKREINALKREAKQYRKQIEADSTIIEMLKYDDYLEKYAREKHNMQRANEDVYIIEE